MKQRNPGHPVLVAESVAQILLEAELDEVYVIGQMEKPELDSLVLYFLLPKDDQKELPQKVVNLFANLRMSVKSSGRWFVVSREADLPSSGEGFGLEEAVLFDALRSNPDHDLMLGIVPPEKSRKTARDVAEKALADTPGGSVGVPLLDALTAEWYYASLHLGEKPVLRISAHLGDEATPKSLAANYESILNKAAASAADTKENEIMYRLMTKILPQANGHFLTLNLDQPKLALFMQTIVDEAYAKQEARKKEEASSN